MRKKHSPVALAPLVLLGVFMVCLLSVLLTGAQALRRLQEQDEGSYLRRTGGQYIAARVRQCEGAGRLRVGEFSREMPQGQGGTLFLEEEDGLCTRIYVSGGWLRELYTAGEGDFAPEDGTALLPAQGVDFRLEDDLLTVCLALEEGEQEFALYVPGGEVVP